MPGRVYLQFIGTATGDTQPSVLIFTDNKRSVVLGIAVFAQFSSTRVASRYVFNCGEGMQRFCMEHKVRLAKLSDIFISNIASSATGGLPGTVDQLVCLILIFRVVVFC
jgi:ribonuclease Z